MKKILVTADHHIAEKFDLSQIERLLGTVTAEANKRDELWVLGDVFHNSRITGRELYLFVTFLQSIKVPTILLAGNHDMFEGLSLLDWVPLVFPNVTVSLNSVSLKIENTSILLGHFNVDESVMGAYDIKLHSGLSANSLVTDLALLGHIHKGQEIQGVKTKIIHPGSLFYIDFNERLDKKQLVELVVDAQGYQINYIPLDPDPLAQLEFKEDELDDLSRLVEVSINTRVKIVIKYCNPLINKADIVRKFDKFNFKDKKIVFSYQSPQENTRDSKSQRDQGGLLHIEDFLKKQEKEVAELIRKYLNEQV